MSNTRILWIVVAVAGALLPGCVTASKYMALQDELARTQEELEYARQNLGNAETALMDMQRNQADSAISEEELAALAAERDALAQQLEEFRRHQGTLAAQGLETVINREEGMFGYRAKGDVLFSSGSANLTKSGKGVLDTVVAELQKTEYPIRVDGHTDTDPVVKTKDKYPRGNIELGAQRAISVRAYLIEKGIPADRVSVASYGEYRPVVQAGDSDSKSRNRRVEIMLRMPTGQG